MPLPSSPHSPVTVGWPEAMTRGWSLGPSRWAVVGPTQTRAGARFGSERDADRLVRTPAHPAVARSAGAGARSRHPMFSARISLLQAELAPRRRGTALDLESIAGIDPAIVAPRALTGDVLVWLGAV